jgi:hypothetical protein
LKSSYPLESLSHSHFNTWGQFVAHARVFLCLSFDVSILSELIDLHQEIGSAQSSKCEQVVSESFPSDIEA